MVAPLPALGLPPEALQSLRSAFAREVAVRLPRLLTVLRQGDELGSAGILPQARADVTMLAEGCSLLGDAAGASALRRLGELLDCPTGGPSATRGQLLDAASTAALLLGRWADPRGEAGAT